MSKSAIGNNAFSMNYLFNLNVCWSQTTVPNLIKCYMKKCMTMTFLELFSDLNYLVFLLNYAVFLCSNWDWSYCINNHKQATGTTDHMISLDYLFPLLPPFFFNWGENRQLHTRLINCLSHNFRTKWSFNADTPISDATLAY